MQKLSDRGCKAVIFGEFVPVTDDSKHPEMVYISFPGDEKSSGGCTLYERRADVERIMAESNQ